MKKFNDIQHFKTIKCIAKISTDTLTELQRQANEIIFKYNMQYAFPDNVQRAYEELEKVFIAIKELEVKNSASASFHFAYKTRSFSLPTATFSMGSP